MTLKPIIAPCLARHQLAIIMHTEGYMVHYGSLVMGPVLPTYSHFSSRPDRERNIQIQLRTSTLPVVYIEVWTEPFSSLGVGRCLCFLTSVIMQAGPRHFSSLICLISQCDLTNNSQNKTRSGRPYLQSVSGCKNHHRRLSFLRSVRGEMSHLSPSSSPRVCAHCILHLYSQVTTYKAYHNKPSKSQK